MSKSRKIVVGILTLILLLTSIAVVGWVSKQVAPIKWRAYGEINQQQGQAIKGFDAISYMNKHSAILGSDLFQTEYEGATWYFSSKENLEQFKTNPSENAPQIGGFCAFAASKGFTAEADPTVFTVVDGKLFLFADQNFKEKWLEELDNGSMQTSLHNWNK